MDIVNDLDDLGPNDILITQYLRPNGAKQPVWVTVDPEIKRKVDTLKIMGGFQVECEELTTGEIHIDCCNDEGVLAAEIGPNDERVNDMLARVINRAYDNWKALQ